LGLTPGPRPTAGDAGPSTGGRALLAATYSLGYGGYVASLILVPKIAHDLYGADLLRTGVAFAAANISLFVFSFLFGRHADVHGRKRIMQAGLALSAIAIFAQAFVFDIWSLVAVRFAIGTTVAMFPAALISYAHQTGWRMGRFSSFISFSWAVGASLTMVSGLVGSGTVTLGPLLLAGWQVTFTLGALSTLAAYAIALALPQIPERHLTVERLPFRLLKRNAHVYLPFLVRHTGANAVWVTFPLYIILLGQGREDIDIFIGAANFINTGSQALFMPLLDRVQRARVLISSGLVCSAITFVLFVSFPDIYILLALQLFLGFSWSLLYVGSIRELMDRNQEKASAAGLLSSTINLAQVIGPLVGGAVGLLVFSAADRLPGYQAPMWLAAGLAIGGLAVQLVAQSRLGRAEAEGQARPARG
jgi:DHA1 family quinolone resistance protein-like MFS transporter